MLSDPDHIPTIFRVLPYSSTSPVVYRIRERKEGELQIKGEARGILPTSTYTETWVFRTNYFSDFENISEKLLQKIIHGWTY